MRDGANAPGHEVIVPDAARIGRWREALKPVTDQYLDELTKKFPTARAAYDKARRDAAAVTVPGPFRVHGAGPCAMQAAEHP